ncbi:MAG TPA: 3-isopropylmalate dehydratase [Synergistetes bacterium]|nr:3-isopropylmalate dehydratase [Synergistota bacterium]
MAESILSGRVWVLKDRQGDLIENIDTDQIFHNAFLHITEMDKMGEHALGNLEGWKDFPRKAKPGDIIIAGRNFGAGSSRQQAVDCFLSLRVRAIIASSFGAIYFRNAVNSGFPVLKCPEIKPFVEKGILETGDEIRVDLLSGEAQIIGKKMPLQFVPMSEVQYDIYAAGGLYNYGKIRSRD